MHTDSELESDTSSINDGMVGSVNSFNSSHSNFVASLSCVTPKNGEIAKPATNAAMTTTNTTNTTAPGIGGGEVKQIMSYEQLENRIDSLLQENRVLKIEIETYKLRIKAIQEENKELRKASVNIQARAEQEEEYISNKLLKKIQSLKKEKETLANNYEREEEFLTNDLSRKLTQLRNEKVQLEQTLEQEQEHMVSKLMKKIEKLEAETSAKQLNLEQLRREKIELENTLEQEQESLVNRLWKRMERLETEKRLLQEKLEQPVSAPMSPRNIQNTIATVPSSLGSQQGAAPVASVALPGLPASSSFLGTSSLPTSSSLTPLGSSEQATNLTEHIINLRREVSRLKANLEKAERDHKKTMTKMAREEKVIRDENLRLQRRLQMEVDRREALCRHLSESESSLEMDDERHFNETSRVRTVSSPVSGYLANSMPVNLNTSNPAMAHPAAVVSSTAPAPVIPPVDRCPTCNQLIKYYPGPSSTANHLFTSAATGAGVSKPILPPHPLAGHSPSPSLSALGGVPPINTATSTSSLNTSSGHGAAVVAPPPKLNTSSSSSSNQMM